MLNWNLNFADVGISMQANILLKNLDSAEKDLLTVDKLLSKASLSESAHEINLRINVFDEKLIKLREKISKLRKKEVC